MSETVRVAIEFKDPVALEQACRDIGATLTRNATATIYHTDHAGDVITLPGWRYPVVVNKNELIYDNYKGNWGDIETLKQLRRRYTTHASLRKTATMGRRLVQQQQIGKRIRLILA